MAGFVVIGVEHSASVFRENDKHTCTGKRTL
jgi:hypothetical protein